MRKIALLLFGVLLATTSLLAQTRTVTGRVITEKGQGIAGVTVATKSSKGGTQTDANGNFSISVSETDKVLIISSVGYKSENYKLDGSSVVNVVLQESNTVLDEVVVTGYSSQKKSTFSGAATVLKAANTVATVPVGAFDQALQGRAPGLQVSSGSGQPGTSATVTIRGIQSIQGSGTQPLYVIDGVPLPAGDVATINPNDFETITILKDANASALYGARGGVGVIVITTKRGKSGTSNFSYRSQFGFTQAPAATNFDLMNSREILQYEERLKLTGNPGWNYSKNNPVYGTLSATQQARYDFLLDSIGSINTDYSKILFRQGMSQSHDLNFSGGNEKTRFYLSASYFDQEGTDLTSRLKRYVARFNVDHTTGKLLMQFNMSAGYSVTTYSEGEFRGNSARNSFQIVWRAKPYEIPLDKDGKPIFGASTNLALKQVGNNIEGLQNTVNEQYQIKINAGLTLAYKLLPSLTIKNVFGIDVADDRWQRAIAPNSYIGSLQTNNSGFLAESYKVNAQLINTTGIVFSKKFNRNDLELGAYFEIIKGYQKGLGFSLFNLDKRLTETGQGAGALPIGAGQTTYPQNASSAKSEFGIRSYFATARYTYDGKYTLNANVRSDGTSRILNPSNREITTWSVGATWNVIAENFMQKQNLFTDLSVRATYGQVPNIGSIATNAFAVNGGLVSVTNYLGPQLPSFGTNTGFAGSAITGLNATTPGNPDLRIENVQKTNIGIDLAMFKSRLRLTFDYYSNKTIDLFVNQPLGATTGFGGTTLPINAGTMTNKGIEIALAVDVIKTKKIDLTVGFNHAINTNNIEDLGLVDDYQLGTFIIRKGLPYGSHYTQHYLGADPATGKPVFEKADGTSTTDPAQGANFATYGTFLPKHVGGFNLDFRYGNVTISALFSYQFDVTRYNNIENWITRGVAGYQSAVNGSKRLLTDQWEKPGDVKFYQSPSYDRGFNSSDIQDASFLRFRNLSIAYNIPGFDFKGTKVIKSARFYVQMQNIAIWSPWRGPDPEDNNNISLNEFPNPKMIVTGLDINF
jgi:TonB-linked SusC/RagA family outer membrane protein